MAGAGELGGTGQVAKPQISLRSFWCVFLFFSFSLFLHLLFFFFAAWVARRLGHRVKSKFSMFPETVTLVISKWFLYVDVFQFELNQFQLTTRCRSIYVTCITAEFIFRMVGPEVRLVPERVGTGKSAPHRLLTAGLRHTVRSTQRRISLGCEHSA